MKKLLFATLFFCGSSLCEVYNYILKEVVTELKNLGKTIEKQGTTNAELDRMKEKIADLSKMCERHDKEINEVKKPGDTAKFAIIATASVAGMAIIVFGFNFLHCCSQKFFGL